MIPISISVVFSFRNEESNIRELVARTTSALDNIPKATYELVFVNDASTDDSLTILLELQAMHPIIIVNMSRRFGVTPCVIAGLAQSRGDVMVYMDSDLQDPPEVIPQMVDRFRNGADVVHTTRIHRDGEGPLKLWLTKQAYRIINMLADINLPENTGDFKLLSRRVVDHLLSLSETDPYMRGLSVWVGFRQDFVLYRRDARLAGTTHFPLIGRGPISEFTRGVTSFSTTPLLLGLVVGLATCVISVGLIIYAAITKILGLSSPGASGVLIAVSFFGGMILFTNGLIGMYIAKIHESIKGRPRYIVSEIVKPNQATKPDPEPPQSDIITV